MNRGRFCHPATPHPLPLQLHLSLPLLPLIPTPNGKPPLPIPNGKPPPQSPSRNTALKPWPIPPSFLPYSHDPSAAAHSCEGYFGNRFSQRTNLVRPSDGTGRRRRSTARWFRCFYSKTLESSMCEGGLVRMNLDRIRMSTGCEKLDVVISLAEEKEIPSFEPGAFEMMENQDDGGGKIVSMDLKEWNGKKMCREIQVNGALRGSSPLLPSRWNGNHHSCLIPFQTHSTLHSIPA